MSEFNKDDYLNDLPDADDFADASAKPAPAGSGSVGSATDGADGSSAATGDAAGAQGSGSDAPSDGAADAGNAADDASDAAADTAAAAGATAAGDGQTDASAAAQPADQAGAQSADQANGDASAQQGEDTLTPLGKAKQEAAEYLEALQRERAEFINFRNRAQKEQERFRQHGIIDVLTALLPALDDIDRIREHSEMDDSFKAVSAKIDKAFAKFGVEKFGEKGEDFDPTKHDAILHKPDPNAEKEVVDTVVEAGYRIGDRVIRAARVVVASPQN